MAARDELLKAHTSLAQEGHTDQAQSAKSVDIEHRQRCKAEADMQVSYHRCNCFVLHPVDIMMTYMLLSSTVGGGKEKGDRPSFQGEGS